MSVDRGHHCQYWDYVNKLVPPQHRHLLDAVLDQEDNTERHLVEIAKYITLWEENLVVPLGLTREDVHKINEISKPELKRRNVLKIWKDKEGLNATYGVLLDRCLQGNDTRTAQKICKILAHANPPLPRGQPLEETVEDEDSPSVIIVKRNLAKIKGSFATLVTRVTTELTRKSINMSEFRLFIITLFSPGDIIFHASNVAEICEAISHHQLWDYSSFNPLEEIVKKFAADDQEMKHWISEYKSELAGFKAVTKIAHYIKACSDDEDIADSEQSLKEDIARYDKRYCRKLSIKLKARVTEKSLDYIDQFWMSIADYFCLPSLSVLLDTIKEGCVEVTWFVPTVLALQVQANIQDSTEFLQQMEVACVTMDEEILHGTNKEKPEDLLLQACRNGQVDEVLSLLEENVEVDTSDPEDGTTPLIIAAETENYELIELLLKHHAQVNKGDKNGYTPLLCSISTAATKLLLQHNADVNITTKDGWTPLKYACMYHEDLKLLIDRGADVNAWSEGPECFSWTPLMLAANRGNLEMCQLLLDHGALVDIHNSLYATALMRSSVKGHLQVVKLLLKHGANPNTQDNDGRSPLLCASHKNHTEVVTELLSHGADTELATVKFGFTPLIAATKGGYSEIVELLLKAKAQVDCIDKSTGWSTLMIAASQGNLPIVKLLIEYGSNISQQSQDSQVTAYDIASIHGHVEVCEELLKHGYQCPAPPTEHMKQEVERSHLVLRRSFLDEDNIRLFRHVLSQEGRDTDVTKHNTTSSPEPLHHPHHTQ